MGNTFNSNMYSSLFYNKNLIDIVQNDIRLTKSYLSLINESPCKFSDKIKHEINEMVKLEKALILLKYDNKNVKDNHIKTIDSTLLVSYKTLNYMPKISILIMNMMNIPICQIILRQHIKNYKI